MVKRRVTAEQRRRQWFDQGAAALQTITGRPDRGYDCPLCACTFSVEDLDRGDLTLEDVPPKSVGGRPLVLTCWPCNNLAGGQVDRHAGKAARADEFALSVDKPEQKLTINGLQGRMKSSNGHMEVWVVPEANHPEAVARQAQLWMSEGLTDANTCFSLPAYVPDRANLSFLRAAFLAVFARWGYRAIAGEAADILRSQFERPDDMVLSALCRNAPLQDPTARQLAVIVEPEPWRGFVVTIGTRCLFLPPPFASRDFFATLDERADTSELLLSPIDWPKYPMHELDLIPPDEPTV